MYTQLYRQIQRIHQALPTGTVSDQDAVLSDLHDELCAAPDALYPARWYPCLIELLTYYCRAILPQTSLSDADQQFVAAEFQRTIRRLHQQARTAQTIEACSSSLLRRLQQGNLPTLETLLQEIQRSVEAAFPSQIATIRERQEPLVPVSRELTAAYRALRKSPWLAKYVGPFFDELFQQFPFRHYPSFAALFRHQLATRFQAPAVLVNTLTGQGIVSHLDIATTLVPRELDSLTFDNQVDEAMRHSSLAALRVARRYLETHFPQTVNGQGLHVACRFADPAAAYNDRSVGLLLALKIVGNLLELELASDTIVTGALDASGQVQPVDHLPEKIAALEQQPEIRRLIYPANSLPVSANGLRLEAVHTFEAAALAYYGEPLRRKLRAVSRRQVLRSAVALATIPVGLLTFKNIFSNPVSEHDLKLLNTARELYQQKSDYDNAIVIFDALVDRFREESATGAKELKADAFGHLGRIYLQQHRQKEGFAAYQQAFDLWKAVHDAERQADALLYRGIAHADTAIVAKSDSHRKQARICYTQVSSLLTPTMKTYTRLRGNVALWTGVLYHDTEEHESARRLVETASCCFQDAGAPWNYQLSRQYLGSILARLGQYDEAFEIFRQTLELPMLQNPLNQVKSLIGLCDVLLSSGQPDDGVEYARKAGTLCDAHDLRLQRTQLQHVLMRHQVLWDGLGKG